MRACSVVGHRPRFWTEGATMVWECERCGERMGAKEYPSAADAERYARGLNVEDRRDIGRRAPLGALPLRLWHRLSRRS